jgi:hypothetical protein
VTQAVAQLKALLGVTFLIVGSVTPIAATAHSEGVEAADPNTPPAVLTFDAAARRYTPLRNAPADWPNRFATGASPMSDHADHAGAAQHPPSHPQQQ